MSGLVNDEGVLRTTPPTVTNRLASNPSSGVCRWRRRQQRPGPRAGEEPDRPRPDRSEQQEACDRDARTDQQAGGYVDGEVRADVHADERHRQRTTPYSAYHRAGAFNHGVARARWLTATNHST